MTTTPTPPLAGAPDLHITDVDLADLRNDCERRAENAEADWCVIEPKKMLAILDLIEARKLVGKPDLPHLSDIEHSMQGASQDGPEPMPTPCSLVPRALLYSESVNDNQVLRDDLWIVTTHVVNRAAASELSAVAPKSASVPEGWKLVPVEPTEAMIHAAEDVAAPRPFGKVYRAMIAAAPAAQLPQPQADADQNYDDYCVGEFADLMKEKMAKARAKGRSGWDDPKQCSVGYLQKLLHESVQKGDPVDVANFCMMLRHYRASTTPSFDVWLANPYTEAQNKSIREDYVPKADVALPQQGERSIDSDCRKYCQREADEAAPDGESEWRRLAMQFDGHRMQAMGHLKVMVEDPQAHKTAAAKFLSEGPLSGEAVLAERIKAIAAESARTAAPSEYAWLVEWQLAGAPITYFAMGDIFPDFDFSTIGKALRFARKEDADSAAAWVARNDKRMRNQARDIRVAEHQWPVVTTPAPLEAQPIQADYDHNEGDGLAGRVQAAQPIPTDLSKRLRDIAWSDEAHSSSIYEAAADEIDRYYGGMVAWKKTAEEKDRASTWVDEIVFGDFVDYGARNGANIVNGMPWSFQYKGFAVTHENDRRYLINVPGPTHTLNFTPGDLLVTHADGTLDIIKDSDRAMLIHCMNCMRSSMERTAPGTTNWDPMIADIKQHIAKKGGAA